MAKLPEFRNPQLLTQALTHRSYFNEYPLEGEDNERLEFLGDAVLKFIMSKLLYERYPKMREGQLTRLRATLENNRYQLAAFATHLGLGKLMLLGKGAEKDQGRKNPELLSDTFEAIVGAYFLDSGLEAVCKFVEPLLISVADQFVAQSQIDFNFKGKFQQWALANVGEIPQYSITDESGLAHAKTFTAEVRVGGKLYGVGCDRSKKAAEKSAAEAALKLVSSGADGDLKA